MSHEGIRIVSEEEARRGTVAEQRLHADAVTPLKVRVKKSEGTGVEIDWKDGHKSSWSFRWLRDGCPCATCNEERNQQGRKPGQPKPKSSAVLPMYTAPPRPASAHPVGRYALQFNWQDGHSGGIYSWDYLRRVCQCAECKFVAEAAGGATN
jgi:DUF971 family protein